MKRCNNCNNQSEEHVKFCESCGSSFEAMQNNNTQPPVQGVQPEVQGQQHDQAQFQPSQQQYQYQAPPPSMWQQQQVQQPVDTIQQAYNEGHRFTKLGGWLLVIVIVNIGGLIYNVVSLFGSLGETIELFGMLDDVRIFLPASFETVMYMTLFGQIIGLAANAFLLIFLIQVFQRKPTFLLFGQLTQLVGVFVAIIVGIVPFAMLGSEFMDPNALSTNIGTVIGGVAGFFLYALYYSKSNRVRVYMRSDEYMSKAILAFKDQPPVRLF